MVENQINIQSRNKREIPVASAKSEFPLWCNYASLSMILGAAGRPISQEELFKKVYPDREVRAIQPEGIRIQHLPNPTFSMLADIAEEIVGETHTVRLLHTGYLHRTNLAPEDNRGTYGRFKLNPSDLLNRFLDMSIPCMVRFISHTVIVTGYEEEGGKFHYHYNDPLEGIPKSKLRENFLTSWEGEDNTQTYGNGEPNRDGTMPLMRSRNLMLVIYPKKKST